MEEDPELEGRPVAGSRAVQLSPSTFFPCRSLAKSPQKALSVVVPGPSTLPTWWPVSCHQARYLWRSEPAPRLLSWSP